MPKAPKPVVAIALPESNPWEDEVTSSSNPYAESSWALASYVAHYQPQFDKVQQGGFVTGAAAKGVLQNTGAPVSALRQIWDLADIDRDGKLSLNEFVIALYLADSAGKGNAVPAALDPSMIP